MTDAELLEAIRELLVDGQTMGRRVANPDGEGVLDAEAEAVYTPCTPEAPATPAEMPSEVLASEGDGFRVPDPVRPVEDVPRPERGNDEGGRRVNPRDRLLVEQLAALRAAGLIGGDRPGPRVSHRRARQWAAAVSDRQDGGRLPSRIWNEPTTRELDAEPRWRPERPPSRWRDDPAERRGSLGDDPFSRENRFK